MIYLVPAVFLANSYVFSPGITIAKKTHLLIWINLAGGLLNIALNVMLVPKLGISGAGLSTLVSYMCIFVLITGVGQRFYPLPHRLGALVSAAIAAALLAVGLPQLGVDGVARWVVNTIAICLFGALCVLLGLVELREIRAAWRLVQSRLSKVS